MPFSLRRSRSLITNLWVLGPPKGKVGTNTIRMKHVAKTDKNNAECRMVQNVKDKKRV